MLSVQLCEMIEGSPAAVNLLIKQLDSSHPQATASRHLYISVLKYFWISLNKEKSLKEVQALTRNPNPKPHSHPTGGLPPPLHLYPNVLLDLSE